MVNILWLQRFSDHKKQLPLPAARAFNIFVALSSSDGYKTMMSHLGPDPKATWNLSQWSLISTLLYFTGRSSFPGYFGNWSELWAQAWHIICWFTSTFISGILRAISTWTIETFFHDKLFADSARVAKVKPVREFLDLTAQRDQFMRFFYQEVRELFVIVMTQDLWSLQVWEKHGFDGIIAPVQALPQLFHG